MVASAAMTVSPQLHGPCHLSCGVVPTSNVRMCAHTYVPHSLCALPLQLSSLQRSSGTHHHHAATAVGLHLWTEDTHTRTNNKRESIGWFHNHQVNIRTLRRKLSSIALTVLGHAGWHSEEPNWTVPTPLPPTPPLPSFNTLLHTSAHLRLSWKCMCAVNHSLYTHTLKVNTTKQKLTKTVECTNVHTLILTT